VTGVCSTRNVEMVRSIGADRVIDYTQEDFTKGTRRYDLILDCVGNHSFSARRNILNPNGICVMVGAPNDGNWIGPLAGVLKVLALSRFVSQSFVAFIGKASKRDLTIMGELMEAGKVTPVIDRRYGLSDVPDAIRYLEDGHARGKVVITLDRNNKAKETPEPCQP
jgi:NADPH:quinone reductase-like Zn-dependent oxidoreductase